MGFIQPTKRFPFTRSLLENFSGKIFSRKKELFYPALPPLWHVTSFIQKKIKRKKLQFWFHIHFFCKAGLLYAQIAKKNFSVSFVYLTMNSSTIEHNTVLVMFKLGDVIHIRYQMGEKTKFLGLKTNIHLNKLKFHMKTSNIFIKTRESKNEMMRGYHISMYAKI